MTRQKSTRSSETVSVQIYMIYNTNCCYMHSMRGSSNFLKGEGWSEGYLGLSEGGGGGVRGMFLVISLRKLRNLNFPRGGEEGPSSNTAGTFILMKNGKKILIIFKSNTCLKSLSLSKLEEYVLVCRTFPRCDFCVGFFLI